MKVGFIGAGMISHTHIPFSKSYRDDMELALVDTNDDMLQETATKYGIRHRFGTLDELLEKFHPDVVHVLTPPQSHLAMCNQLLDAGCHVFLEKPMCNDAKEARAIARKVTATGLKLCVDHNHKFDPYMLQAREWIDSGTIGDICGMESYYGFDLGTNPQSRYFREAYTHWGYRIPGGLFQNLIDHPMYVVLDYLPDPTKIVSVSHEKRIMPGGVPDELRIFMSDDNCTAFVSVSLAASPRFHHFDIRGTRGTIHVDVINQYAFLYKHMAGPKAISRAVMNFKSGGAIIKATVKQIFSVIRGRFTTYPGTETIIHRFYDSIVNDTEPPVSMDKAVKVLEIGDKVWKQIKYPTF